MRKNVLLRVNALLGALSVTLAGCHVQKKAAESQPQEEESTPPVEVIGPEPVKPLYGVPMPDEPIMCKYGAPPTRR